MTSAVAKHARVRLHHLLTSESGNQKLNLTKQQNKKIATWWLVPSIVMAVSFVGAVVMTSFIYGVDTSSKSEFLFLGELRESSSR